jgi:hypothetical protein
MIKKRQIEISRNKQYANKARAIGIYINNNKVATITDGETKCIEVDIEENEIYVKIDWCKTKPVKFITLENETTSLELGSNASVWNLIFNTSEYLYLKRA